MYMNNFCIGNWITMVQESCKLLFSIIIIFNEKYVDGSNIKSLRMRKILSQMLAAWKVIKSESRAPITTSILLEDGRRS